MKPLLWLSFAIAASVLLVGQTAEPSLPASTFGIACDGKADDSLGLNLAGQTSNVSIYFPPGAVCLGDFTINSSNAKWTGTGTTFRHVANDTAHYLLTLSFSNNVSMSGFTFDLNGVLQTTGTTFMVFILNANRFLLTDNTYLNSGVVQPTMGAVQVWQSSGAIEKSYFAPTITGTDIFSYTLPSNALSIYKNELAGSGQNGIYVSGFNYSAAYVDVSTNFIHDVTAQSGTGQIGNCVFVYQAMYVNVHDNVCVNARFSAYRLNSTRYVRVHHNAATGTGEVAMYAELGAEGNSFTDNILNNVWAGIDLTNEADRILFIPNIATGNMINSALSFGIEAENDVVTGNIINGTPYGVELGHGTNGFGIVVEGNRCTGPGFACILVSSNLATTGALSHVHENTASGMSLGSAEVVALETGGPPLVTGISQSNPAVISFQPGYTANAGESYAIDGIPGMTQINGMLCSVSKATASTITCSNINSTAFSPYLLPADGRTAFEPVYRVYSAGTTPAQPFPTVVHIVGQTIPFAYLKGMAMGSSGYAPDAGAGLICKTGGGGTQFRQIGGAFGCQ